MIALVGTHCGPNDGAYMLVIAAAVVFDRLGSGMAHHDMHSTAHDKFIVDDDADDHMGKRKYPRLPHSVPHELRIFQNSSPDAVTPHPTTHTACPPSVGPWQRNTPDRYWYKLEGTWIPVTNGPFSNSSYLIKCTVVAVTVHCELFAAIAIAVPDTDPGRVYRNSRDARTAASTSAHVPSMGWYGKLDSGTVGCVS